MLVRITPPGRTAKVFHVAGVKRSWHISGGCATATIPLPLAADDADRILLARVDTFGPLGLDWSGMVWRRPRHGEPIECAGLANALTFNRRSALYADTRLTPWVVRVAAGANPDGWTAGMGTASLTASIVAGTYSTGANVSWIHGPFRSTDNVRLIGTIAGLAAQTEVLAATYLSDGSSYRVEATLGNGAFDIPVARAATGYVQIIVRSNTTYSPGTDAAVVISGLKLHAVSGIATGAGGTLTPEGVIGHVCDALPTWALPAGAAYRRHIGTSGVTVASLAFPDADTDDKAKADAVVGQSAHHFGFYPRRVAGRAVTVPVYQAVETAPTLSLDVSRVADDRLRDRSADGLSSAYVARYVDSRGVARFVTVADADTANYLNTIGYSIVGTVDASWTASSATATAAATASAAAAKASDTEGSVGIVRARLANGRTAPALACMPGRMVRVRGMGPGRELVVSSVEADGAKKVSVAFAPKATDLQYLTAQALGR